MFFFYLHKIVIKISTWEKKKADEDGFFLFIIFFSNYVWIYYFLSDLFIIISLLFPHFTSSFSSFERG